MGSVLITADAALRFKPNANIRAEPGAARQKRGLRTLLLGSKYPCGVILFLIDLSRTYHAKNLSLAHLYSMPTLPPSSHPYPHLLLHIRHSSLICSLTFFVLFCSKILRRSCCIWASVRYLLRSIFHPMSFGQFEHGCMTLHISST